VSKRSIDDGQGPRKEDCVNMLYTIMKAHSVEFYKSPSVRPKELDVLLQFRL